MTKGLHKDSLRKVDNPHQWMIDDARMELIQQIKAEIERRIEAYNVSIEKYAGKKKSLKAERDSWKWAELKSLLSFLDTLQEQPVCEGLEEEIGRLWESFADEMEGPHNLFDIYARLARHFAQWGAEHLKK